MTAFAHARDFYQAHQGEEVIIGKVKARVTMHRTESRGGSWERGFRFYESKWGALRAKDGVSLDGGKTWWKSAREAFRGSKGKVRLTSSNHGEFAFNSIQDINRQYEGPGYRWRR